MVVDCEHPCRNRILGLLYFLGQGVQLLSQLVEVGFLMLLEEHLDLVLNVRRRFQHYLRRSAWARSLIARFIWRQL